MNFDREQTGTLLSEEELWALQEKVNAMGPRLTGCAAHNAYIDLLKTQLESYGLTVHEDEHPFVKWQAKRWGLAVQGQDGVVEELPTTFYYPYSGQTPESGVTGDLVYCKNSAAGFQKAKGKIAVVQVAIPSVPTSLILKKRHVYPAGTKLPATLSNAVIGSVLRGPKLAEAAKTGVLAVICVWGQYSSQNAAGQVLPFTTGYQGCPGLWVDEKTGGRLREFARQGAKATLVLDAEIDRSAASKTLYCVLPGQTAKETVIINTHTDGPNACEENGGIALLSLARYFANHPQRNRTFVFVFATGHFQIPQFGVGKGQASSRWLKNHPELWDGTGTNARAVAGVTMEHLGCSEWRDNAAHSDYKQTNPIELELVYTGNKTMEDIYLRALKNRATVRSVTLRPRNSIYFGEGQPLYQAGIPTISLVPGPDYLCKETPNGEIDKLNPVLMKEQIDTFFALLLELDRTPAQQLGKPQKQSLGIW